MSDLKRDLFISYNWNIKDSVKKLHEYLCSQNYTVYRDEQTFAANANLATQISQAIRNSRILICCITRAYDTSPNCIREINLAANDYKIPIIALMFENVNVQNLQNVNLIISPLLRINIFEEPQAMLNWHGSESSVKLKRAIDGELSRNANDLKQTAAITYPAPSKPYDFRDQEVFIYNRSKEKYLYISNDILKGDNVVKAHETKKDLSDKFLLKYINETNEFYIYSPSRDQYLFVSNDTIKGDNVVEAHGAKCKNEQRNRFSIERIGDTDEYFIYNRTYNKYLFVSNDFRDGENVVEAHNTEFKCDVRNRFVLRK